MNELILTKVFFIFLLDVIRHHHVKILLARYVGNLKRNTIISMNLVVNRRITCFTFLSTQRFVLLSYIFLPMP